ncbi:MAG: M28 family peptidase [Cytophagales bacterium]|nr:M28 family peptidase [Bernardetiaceae bacterium]MDW8210855.1 M28 family peptidase [Cytophagales bacterium]
MHPAAKFNVDSAYEYIKKQVALGPRVPNTEPHRKAAEMFLAMLERFGWQVQAQDFEAVAYNKTILRSRNIIATYNPEAKRRILLAAHWDTRPYADMDPDTTRRREPILGANDGGSGVGVLLEVARAIGMQQYDSLKINHIGIDIILFDSEDYGPPEDEQQNAFKPDAWCLGSQYWAKNKHRENYAAYYGILLDMVGAHNARFLLEGHSMEYAPSVVKKVWDTANQLGFGKYFVYQTTSSLIDDHLYINQLAGIPTINIIQYENSFGDFWHTHRDNMDIISKETLYAVGTTLLQVLYNENAAAVEP